MGFTKESATEAGKKSSRAGTPNQSTTEIRESFKNLIEGNLATLQNDLNKLEPQQRVKAIIELSKFVLPTLKAVDIETANSEFPKVVVYLPDNGRG